MEEVVSTYGERKSFLSAFNPSLQNDICRDPDACFRADVPTLGMLRTAYGDNTPIMWLIPQLTDLSEFCGCRDKLTGAQLEQCARSIVDGYFYLKVTELMLFFHRFKMWRYGGFYGTVDPMRIMEALNSFRKEYSLAHDKIEQEDKEKKRDEESKSAVTWEEYCELKGINRINPFDRI